MSMFHVRDAAAAVETAIRQVELRGDRVITEDRQMTKELQNLVIVIKNPLDGFPIPNSGWDMKALEIYGNQFFDEGKHGFEYTYGQRINHRDQLTRAISHLKKEPNTRRAVIKTWQPCVDYDNQHVPCLQFIEFLARDNKLHLTAVFRSHDIGRAYASNIYGLGRVQAHVAAELGIKVGTMTIHSVSAHIYEV
jgi:thymidylate synthase